MNKQDFLNDIKESMEIESNLQVDTNLKDLDEWDSMMAMILVAYVSEKFEVNLTPKDIMEITTVDTLIERIGIEKFNKA